MHFVPLNGGDCKGGTEESGDTLVWNVFDAIDSEMIVFLESSAEPKGYTKVTTKSGKVVRSATLPLVVIGVADGKSVVVEAVTEPLSVVGGAVVFGGVIAAACGAPIAAAREDRDTVISEALDADACEALKAYACDACDVPSAADCNAWMADASEEAIANVLEELL